jgi:hypothetical protein
MPSVRLSRISWVLTFLLLALSAQADDLHIRKNLSVGGNLVSTSEISVKGARERTVTTLPTGNLVTIRQCDLKRTVMLNEQAQTYFVANDPQDEAAMKAAALVTGAQAPASGGTITQTATITDTGERKTMFGYTARHVKSTVLVQSSPKACSQVNQKFEIDGWYTDLGKEQASCQYLPPVQQSEGCTDRVVVRRSGSGKTGYPLSETITFHNSDNTTTKVENSTSQLLKQTLEPSLFDVPAAYREVKTLAELNSAPVQVPAQPAAPSGPAVAQQPTQASPVPSNSFAAPAAGQFAGMAAGFAQPSAMMGQAAGQQMAMAAMQGGGAPMQNGMPGMQGAPAAAPAALPQALGPKAPGKIRIGVAPSQAQVGQGNNAGDYGTPIRNSIVLLMSGPAVEIAALDSHLPIQIQAEAQQKQCDYIVFSNVTVKHGGGGFGKFMKAAGPMSSMVPMAGMAGGMGGAMAGQMAGMAASAAAMSAQEQAMNQLAGFNGQIKSKDDVTIAYQLTPTGQEQPRLSNTLKGKAKSDGEDVMTPLIQQAANTILTEVTKK